MKEDPTVEITEQVKLTDLVKLSFFPLNFLPDVGVLCTSATACVPRVASVISLHKEKAALRFVLVLKLLLKLHLMTNQLRL